MEAHDVHPKDLFAIGPAPHRVSRTLRARNPGRVQKESEKSTPGQGPKSAQRVRPAVSKESEKSLKPDFRTLFGLFLRLRGALFGHFWGLATGYSFRTLFGLFRVSGPEGPGRPCVGRGRSQGFVSCSSFTVLTGLLSGMHSFITVHLLDVIFTCLHHFVLILTLPSLPLGLVVFTGH